MRAPPVVRRAFTQVPPGCKFWCPCSRRKARGATHTPCTGTSHSGLRRQCTNAQVGGPHPTLGTCSCARA
eukprot:7373267-Alexandrium_andersonii.AAC.1